MRVDTIYVADILARDSGIQWYEGIAIVQGLCDELIRSGAGEAQFPSPMDIRLAATGEVSVLGLAHAGEGAGASAARLLGSLIGGDAPVQLRLLLSEATNELSEFSTRLERFERPGRAGIIRGVYERVTTPPGPADRFDGAAATASTPGSFLAAIDESVARHVPAAGAFGGFVQPAKRATEMGGLPTPPPSSDAPPAETAAPRRPRIGRRAAMALAGATAVAGTIMIAVLLAGLSPQPTRLGSEAAQVSSRVASVGYRLADRLVTSVAAVSDRLAGTGLVTEDGAAVSPAESAATAVPVRRAARAPRAAPSGQAVAAAPADPGLPARFLRSPPALTLPGVPADQPDAPRAARAPDAGELPDPAAVFSADHPEVVPPVSIRPQLPTEPPPNRRPDDIGIIDLVVAEDGHVERARLQTRPRDIRDVLIVSAAKSWRFEPATLNGHPVKYRLQVWINLP
jgi:hypothetical protein